MCPAGEALGQSRADPGATAPSFPLSPGRETQACPRRQRPGFGCSKHHSRERGEGFVLRSVAPPCPGHAAPALTSALAQRPCHSPLPALPPPRTPAHPVGTCTRTHSPPAQTHTKSDTQARRRLHEHKHMCAHRQTRPGTDLHSYMHTHSCKQTHMHTCAPMRTHTHTTSWRKFQPTGSCQFCVRILFPFYFQKGGGAPGTPYTWLGVSREASYREEVLASLTAVL